MIRLATLRDWVEVKDKVIAFNDEYFKIPVDVDKLNAWFLRHLDDGVILLSKDGLISGLFVSDPVRNWTVLAETAWYDTGRDGLRLLLDFISTGQEAEVDEVRLTTLNTTPERAVALLARLGFEEIERSHRLTL